MADEGVAIVDAGRHHLARKCIILTASQVNVSPPRHMVDVAPALNERREHLTDIVRKLAAPLRLRDDMVGVAPENVGKLIAAVVYG